MSCRTLEERKRSVSFKWCGRMLFLFLFPNFCTIIFFPHLTDKSSLTHVLSTLTRALARRVFELHRGSKNKKLMAVRQEELQLRK
jgi:hypothetical protein